MAIERTEFDSGLRVITDRMPGVHSATVGIWVGTGSRDERSGMGGASHFLEHLLFKGTKSRSAQEIAEAFDAVGGDANAFTSKETTCYYARVLDRDLPMALEHLCDMLQNSLLRSPDVDSERQVILEEIHMHEDTPDDLVHDLFMETLWPGHSLGLPVLGTVDTITEMKRDQIKRFYAHHYSPSNFAIVAAGNVHHDEVIKLVRRSMETGRVKRTTTTSVEPSGKMRVPVPTDVVQVKRRSTEQAHIVAGTSGMSRGDPDRFAFGVINAALGGGMSSRLFQEIREKRGLAYSVYSYHSMYAEAGLFAVYAGTAPSKAHEVLKLIRGELEDVASKGVTEEELERAKGHMRGSLVLSLEDTSGRMSRVGKSEISGGEILSIGEVLKRVGQVTIDEARAAAARILSQPMAMTVLGPFKKGEFKGENPSGLNLAPLSVAASGELAAHHNGGRA